MYPSVHAAYQKKAVEISVSATALYNKLQRIELPVSRALVHEKASDLQQLLKSLNVERPSPLGKEYWLRIIDGSCLAGTERRLSALRPHAAKPLPGKTIASRGTRPSGEIFLIDSDRPQQQKPRRSWWFLRASWFFFTTDLGLL